MFRTFLPVAVLIGSYAGLIAAIVLTNDKLPPVVASHFNAGGAPDGWMPRDSYLWSMVGVATIIPAFIVGSFYILGFLGDGAMNLPHRDYWLAPERRTETYKVLFSAGLWIATIVVLTVLGVHLFVVAANAAHPVALSSYVWLLLGGVLSGVGCILFWLLHRFKLPQCESQD